jgi:hypothetical protein
LRPFIFNLQHLKGIANNVPRDLLRNTNGIGGWGAKFFAPVRTFAGRAEDARLHQLPEVAFQPFVRLRPIRAVASEFPPQNATAALGMEDAA